MKLNKLTIITLVLLTFLSLGAVSATNETVISDDGVSTYDDLSVIIINDSSYSNYFNESNGNILDGQINNGDTIQIGDINDKIFTINKNLTITSLGDNYTINNGMIQLIGGSDGSSISNLNIKIDNTVYAKNSSVLLSGIKIVDASNIDLVNNSISINGTGNVTGISIDGGNDISLTNSLVSVYGENKTYGLNIESSNNIILNYNEINVDGVSDSVDWSKYPEPGIYQTLSLYINNCQNLTVNSNNIEVKFHKVKGSFDTIIGVEIANSQGVKFSSNDLLVNGNSYVYGLEVLGTSTAPSSIIINDNDIKAIGVNYADAVKVGSYVNGTISGNTISAIAEDASYGLYVEAYNGGTVINVDLNNITSKTTVGDNKTADNGARGVSLYMNGNFVSLGENNIVTIGNYSTGIESFAGINNIILQGNLINTTGDLSAICVSIIGGENITVVDNNIITDGVSSPADWSTYPVPYGFDTIGVLIKGSSYVVVNKNNISTNYHNVIGSYDSLEGVQIVSSSNVSIENNKIETIGNNYGYGLEIGGTSISPSEDVTVNNNEIITNGNYYASSIVLNTFAQGNIVSNNILSNATNASYGIYSQSGSNYNISENKIKVLSKGNGSYEGSYGFSLYAASNNIIKNNNVIVDGIVSYGLSLESSSNNNQILDNKIDTTAKQLTYGIGIKDSENNILKSNNLTTVGSSISADYDLLYNPTFKTIGIFLTNAINTTVNSNIVETTYDNYTNYGTIRGIFIEKSNDVTVSENYVNTTGESYTYGIGANGYLNKDYSVDDCDNLIITSNTVFTNSNYYGAGIDMGSPVSGEVSENIIKTNGNSFTYGLYDASFNGKNSVNYISNTIISSGNINYGIELYRSNSTIFNNTITAVGNYSMGIGLISSKNNVITNNYIKTTGNDNATHIYNGDSLKEENTGIKLNSASTLNDIENNTIITTGNYTVNAASSKNTVTYNKLVANTLIGDNSVNASLNNTVHDNQGIDSELIANNLTMDFKDGSKYAVVIYDDKGNPAVGQVVTFTINGVTYNRTADKDGIARLNINLAPGTYDIVSTWNNLSSKNTIKVNNWNSSKLSIVSEDFNKSYKNGSQYVVSVKYDGNDVSGVVVSILVNGKTYTRTTDSNGQAKLNINLGVGNYKVTSSISNYGVNASYTSNVGVIKAATKLYGEPTTISRGSYYTVSLVGTVSSEYPISSQAGMVININGVNYYRTTNDNGQGQLKINLVPGTYTITSAFNGNSNCQGSGTLINTITVV